MFRSLKITLGILIPLFAGCATNLTRPEKLSLTWHGCYGKIRLELMTTLEPKGSSNVEKEREVSSN
jgi:hypothetical protein